MLMATCTPNATQERVDEEDDGPPVVPEQADAKIPGGVLGPPQQQGHIGRIDPDGEAMVDLLGPPITAKQLLELREAFEQIEAQTILDLQAWKTRRLLFSLFVVSILMVASSVAIASPQARLEMPEHRTQRYQKHQR